MWKITKIKNYVVLKGKGINLNNKLLADNRILSLHLKNSRIKVSVLRAIIFQNAAWFESLSIIDCHLSTKDLIGICNILISADLPKLKEIRITVNKNYTVDVKKFLKLFDKYRGLTSIALAGFHWQPESIIQLLMFVANNIALQSLDLSSNDFNKESLIALLQICQKFPELKILKLSKCINSPLDRFNIEQHRNTRSDDVISKNPVLTALRTYLASNNTLLVLDLSKNYLGDAAHYVVNELCRSSTTLKEINLSDCRISSAMMPFIFRDLERSDTIESVDLSNNKIDARSVGHLVFYISASKILKRLNILGAELSHDSFRRIATDLYKNVTLKTFLSSVPIYAHPGVAGSALVQLITQNTVIEKMQVDLYYLNKNQQYSLWAALSNNTHIKTLIINVLPSYLAILADFISKNKSLRKIYVYCPFYEPGEIELDSVKGLIPALIANNLLSKFRFHSNSSKKDYLTSRKAEYFLLSELSIIVKLNQMGSKKSLYAREISKKYNIELAPMGVPSLKDLSMFAIKNNLSFFSTGKNNLAVPNAGLKEELEELINATNISEPGILYGTR